jgi:hypothetical protein
MNSDTGRDINQEIQRQEGLKRVFTVNCICIVIECFKRRNLGLRFVGLRLTGRERTLLNTDVPIRTDTTELCSVGT